MLVYDGDCGFCTACARWLARGGVEIVPWQRLDLARAGLSVAEVSARVYWLESGRAVDSGAGAVGLSLIARGRPWSLVGRVIRLAVVRPLAEVVYRFVARHRHQLPGSTCSF